MTKRIYLFITLICSLLTTNLWAASEEQQMIDKINQDRKIKKYFPCGSDPDLNILAEKELASMMEHPELAKTLKNRLKTNSILELGFSTLLFASPEAKQITKDMIKQKAYSNLLAKDINSIGIALVEADSEPPFYQILIIGAKAKPIDPCNGQPGLSESQVNNVKHGVDGKVQACYDKAIEKGDPNIKGRIAYSLDISPKGEVTRNLLFVSEELKNDVLPCVENHMKQLQFPKPCGDKPVNVRAFGWDFTPPQGNKRIGRLSKNAITGAIQRKRPQMKRCYDKELRHNKQLAGQILLKFLISPKGDIVSVAIAKDTIGNAQLADCIREQALKVVFPAPQYGGDVEVEFPLDFAPEK